MIVPLASYLRSEGLERPASCQRTELLVSMALAPVLAARPMALGVDDGNASAHNGLGSIAIVQQDFFLFTGNIAENISLGDAAIWRHYLGAQASPA